MGIIFFLSSQQGVPLAPSHFWNFIANKLAHIFWFALLCFAFYRAGKSKFLAIFLTTMYGAADEFHQMYVPTRTGSVRDIFVDFLAACIAGFILWKLYPNLPKKLRDWLEV